MPSLTQAIEASFKSIMHAIVDDDSIRDPQAKVRLINKLAAAKDKLLADLGDSAPTGGKVWPEVSATSTGETDVTPGKIEEGFARRAKALITGSTGSNRERFERRSRKLIASEPAELVEGNRNAPSANGMTAQPRLRPPDEPRFAGRS